MADLPEVEAGTIGRRAPLNFTPFPKADPPRVRLRWNQVTDADLRDDIMRTSTETDKTADIGVAPDVVTGHNRQVLGYKLHKGSPGFTPDGILEGQGNVLKDQTTLTPGVTEFLDTDVVGGTTVAYRIATVIEE